MEAIRLIRRCAKYVSDFKTHFVDDDDAGNSILNFLKV